MKTLLFLLTAATVLGACTSSPRFAPGPATPEARAWGSLVSRAFAEGPNLHGVLIEYQGIRVVEATADGWDSSLSTGHLVPTWTVHGPDTVHDVRSVTKSVVALLAGTVLARHPEASLSLRIRDFPDLASRASPDALDVTLEDWLGMTSGLAWKEWGHPWWDSDETALVWTEDPWGHVLSRPATAPRGSRFVYSGGSTQVAAAILERIDGRPLDAIAAADLWGPLGVPAPSWGRRADGQVLAFAGLGLGLRDLAKLATLVLEGGTTTAAPWSHRNGLPGSPRRGSKPTPRGSTSTRGPTTAWAGGPGPSRSGGDRCGGAPRSATGGNGCGWSPNSAGPWFSPRASTVTPRSNGGRPTSSPGSRRSS